MSVRPRLNIADSTARGLLSASVSPYHGSDSGGRGDGPSPTPSSPTVSEPSRPPSNLPLPHLFAPPTHSGVGTRESTESSGSPDMKSEGSPRLSLKRTASLDLIPEDCPSDSKDSTMEDYGNNSAYHRNRKTTGSSTKAGFLSLEAMNSSKPCLCNPGPKVRRPRNAFILFRQACQAQVVAENPGIANPEISKIIAAIWRGQPQDVRDKWKGYAEDEKVEHRKLYPNYRYQPRRAGRAKAKGGRAGPGGATGSSGNGSGGDGDDSGRCPKCGGRYIVTPRTPSTPRLVSGSTSSQQPLHSAADSGSTDGSRTSSSGYPYGSSRPPSPYADIDNDYRLNMDIDMRHTQYYSGVSSRRPLPQHGRPNSTNVASQNATDDLSSESDVKRRRYEQTPAYAAPNRYGRSGGAGGPEGTGFSLPYRPTPGQHFSDTSTPTTPTANAFLPSGASGRPSPSWPGGHPPPRHEASRFSQGYGPAGAASARSSYSEVSYFRDNHPNALPSPAPATPSDVLSQSKSISVKSEYMTPGLPGTPAQRGNPLPVRLPPPSSSYGYYQTSGGSAGSGLQTPSTALSGLSMASTPGSSTPSGAPGSRNQQQQQPQLGFNDASLKLPPLQTHMATAGSQSPARSDSSNGANLNTAAGGTSQAMSSVHNVAAGGIVRINDVRSFAFSSTPVMDSCVDKTSQESGIRAMVMSIPYLNKIEVLRRISPQLPLTTRRGPIIAIEGHSAALTAAVGQVVEKALLQSGECALRVWRSSVTDRAKETANDVKDEEDISRMDIDNDSKDTDTTKCAPATSLDASRETLASYHEFMLPWHTRSQDMVKHIKGATPASTTSTQPQYDELNTKAIKKPAMAPTTTAISISSMTLPPPAPPSPTSPDDSPKPSLLTPSRSSSSSPHSGARANQTHSPRSPSVSPLPVALVTGGYSVALADHFATHVPIEDEYAPIDHWHWMATLWRGVAQPDLVVYADAKPQDKHMDTPINRNAQEGVMVVHAPPKTDGETVSSDRLIDEMTERRLGFEVMEWVRTSPFRAMWMRREMR